MRLRRSGALLSALTLLLGLSAIPLATSAGADPVVSIVAGAGGDGLLVNEVPATTAQLWGPSDVAVGPSGTFYIADTYHHQVRRVDATSVIHAFAGTGSAGCDAAGTVFYQPRGLATDSAGNIYVANTVCGLVERIGDDGTVTVVAGHYDPNGFPTTTIVPGMPATSAWLSQPAGLDYDDETGALFIADQYSHRVLKVVDGVISVVAGTGAQGFSGDGGLATSATLSYPRDVKYTGGKLLIADTSNNRVRSVDASGVITTFLGNGAAANGGDGGQASLAAVTTPSGVAVDETGAVYVATGSSGHIRKVEDTGLVSTAVTLPGSVSDVDVSLQGELLVTGNSGVHQEIFKVTGLVTPPPPTNHSPEITGPIIVSSTPNEPLLKHHISFQASDADGLSDIVRYEYGWALTATATQPSTATQVYTVGQSKPAWLNYRPTRPDQDYWLLVRAVDATGATSSWASQLVHTPKKPQLLALGDSVTSGHHRLPGETFVTCEDASFGYPYYVWETMKASLPARWVDDGGYVNLAFSGFSTSQVISGGQDACGAPAPYEPLTQAKTLLSQRPGSWSRIVGSVGIDDTNWTQMVSTVVAHNVSTVSYTEDQCRADLAGWNGWRLNQQGQVIRDGISTIVDQLRSSDAAATVTLLNYYNIASGTALVPATCETPINEALARMQVYLKGGIKGRSVRFVAMDDVMHGRADYLQTFDLTWDQAQGWPHPNAAGASVIAGTVKP